MLNNQYNKPMKTRCPKCSTTYQVSQSQLNIAESKVRCANCQHVFDGRLNLVDDQVMLKENLDTKQDEGSIIDETTTLESFLQPKATKQPVSHLWVFTLSFFICLLAIQALWLVKDSAAPSSLIGRISGQICSELSFCQLNNSKLKKKLTLVSHSMYSHPVNKEALVLSGQFTNDAPTPQQYPLVLVTIFNKNSEVIYKRYFKSSEYLSNLDEEETSNDLQSVTLDKITSHGEANFNIAIIDPGLAVRAYTIDLM